MLVNFGPKTPFFSIFKPQTPTITSTLNPKPRTQTMSTTNLTSNNKRPTCPSCTRPTKLCLCTRFKTPILDNNIAVTILQHSLEKKHPLNSAKIAKLGLKNVDIAHVSDVLNEAQFVIQLGQSNGDVGMNDLVEKCEKIESLEFLESNGDVGMNDFVENQEKIEPLQFYKSNGDVGLTHLVENGENIRSLGFLESDTDMGLNNLGENGEKIESLDFFESNGDEGMNNLVKNCEKIESLNFLESNSDVGRDENRKKTESLKPADISFIVNKKGVIIQNQGFDKLLVDQSAIRNGFRVRKIRRGLDGSKVEEFDIEVGPGTLLLFPSESSIAAEDIDFDVKNLIVLDGTWAKATRMYKENPWLKLLPHLKLDIDKLSLYAEVRRQPKAGCLSSIESIVYAMKAIGGEDVEKLDCLLDVFESMVVDQRRCKDEALKLESNISSM